ncbi:hypothetical protein DFA_01909 [Cavenderia fasciculata]|uniref:RING-type domain-containing protein n=1 Tax=Cavenderia fasciculata TaxID=261658 RepID=F4PQR2_CACFS|nr:uncharacterized protein DFA_01909 [Cavenderia fasciculata]EGG22020.1 hypothetical protein DFA_01909 [Cavenderia fasciculata]|eukprot:XP_004359871.1 hypothetical protein DFA_01909 [Cavenderia fasciculata]
MSGERESLSIEERVANQSDLDTLTCSICLSLITAPVKQCVSGHLGCEACLDHVAKTTGTCPQCRTPILNGGLSRSLVAAHMLASIKIHCENQFRYSNEQKKWVKDARGCQEIVTVETSNDHKLICKYNLLKCPHQGCNVEVLKDDMTSHLVQCKYQSREKISCPFGTDICKFIGTKTEIDQHILNQLSDHLQVNNQRIDDKFNSLQQEFTKSIESIKESYNQQSDSLESQMQSLKQTFQSKLDRYKNSIMIDTDEKFRKYKDKTNEMIKHTTVHSEWVIENFGEKYKSKADQDSDDFKMGGFDWYISSYMDSEDDDTGQLGFYVFLHNNPGKLVKMCFTLEVVFSRSQRYSQRVTGFYNYQGIGKGYDIDPKPYLKGLQDNDSVTVRFKGFVASINDDPRKK